jgi:phenylalanyl-tRNA synthetase alpha chain
LHNENKEERQQNKMLLRTHTSPVQVRYMEKHQPPLRVVSAGKVFRHEATDKSHEFQFYQLEGLMVDKDIRVSHLKSVMEQFLQSFFNNNKLKIRLRHSYFPFTEPSFEIDLQCFACQSNDKKCSICKEKKWIELAGAGMVHPNVFKASGYKEKWHGFAFGCGIDRLTMIKYGIEDIRLFHCNDLRLLQQF